MLSSSFKLGSNCGTAISQRLEESTRGVNAGCISGINSRGGTLSGAVALYEVEILSTAWSVMPLCSQKISMPLLVLPDSLLIALERTKSL